MSVSPSERKDLLLKSFDILKNNIEDNSRKISEIIAKMAKIDASISVEMWSYCLDKGKNLISYDAYNLCGGTIYELEKTVGNTAVIKILKENPNISEIVFGYSSDICASTMSIIMDTLRKGEMDLAERMIGLVNSNNNKEQSFGEVLEYISDLVFYDDKNELYPKIASLLMHWSEQITNKESKARITVSLLDYI